MEAHSHSQEYIDQLLSDLPSFVDQTSGSETPNFWNVTETGDQSTDIKRGERMAEQAIKFCQKHHSPMLIARTLASIAQQGRTNAVEFGFLARIACAAAAGSLN